MGKIYGKFKYQVGEVINTYNRNLRIIEAKYVPKECTKNGKKYTNNQKMYKYKCLNCGNEDWVVEYSLDDRQHCGCNVCCNPPKKIVKGFNDISTTDVWMMELFVDKHISETNSRYSKKETLFKCPDCGRLYMKKIGTVYANHGLNCSCGDGWSYPNKYMYALLEQLNVVFQAEKTFSWSENKIYDDYIEYNGLKIITEQHGIQHYKRSIGNRSVEEEIQNDTFKKELAIRNGIDYYFTIDCRKSDSEFIRHSILSSGLLDIINISGDIIDWDKCDLFAHSNFAKTICDYKTLQKNMTHRDIANIFHVSYNTILKYIKIGSKYGWCEYEKFDDRKKLDKCHRINHGSKPIYCETIDMYFRDSSVAESYLSNKECIFFSRQIRQSIQRNNKYRGYKFLYVSQNEFNTKKQVSPNKVVGDFFVKE